MTIVDIHTGGRWKGGAAELGQHVRPEFACLIRECLQRGIHVAITTFSTQKNLLRQVLEGSLRTSSELDIPIYGGADEIAPNMQGKQSQLILARRYFDEKSHVAGTILVGETVLVDDDGVNIRIANDDGYRTIHYNPEDSQADDALVIKKEQRQI